MNHSDQQDLRIVAMPHVLSTEKGRIDVQRQAGGNVNDLKKPLAAIQTPTGRIYHVGGPSRGRYRGDGRTRPGDGAQH